MENDNQHTEFLISRILNEKATRQEEAELLVAIYRSLWSLQDLDLRIAKIHKELCDKCELKKAALRKNSSGLASVAAAMAGNKLPWLIVAILVLIVAALLGIDLSPLIK